MKQWLELIHCIGWPNVASLCGTAQYFYNLKLPQRIAIPIKQQGKHLFALSYGVMLHEMKQYMSLIWQDGSYLLPVVGWHWWNCMSKSMVLSMLLLIHESTRQQNPVWGNWLVFQTSDFDHIEFNQVKIFLLIKLLFIQLNSFGVGCLVWKIMAAEMYVFSPI